MRPLIHARPLVAAALILLGAGCAASHPDIVPLYLESGALLREAESMTYGSAADSFLTVAHRLKDEAESRVEKAPDAATLLYLESTAAARVTVAASQALRRQEEAEECATAAADARRDWMDAVRLLEQTEKVAGQTARGVERTPTEDPPADPLPPFPEWPADSLLSADTLRAEAARWTKPAGKGGVPVADLEARLEAALRAADNPKLKPGPRRNWLRVGAWPVVEMAYRVQSDLARRQCLAASERALEYARHRDSALWSMVELERGMKEGARAELDEERRRLADREQSLYESLKQFEGKFATIRREARGTIMSLSDILFDFDKATLRREAELNLAKVALILQQFPEMGIAVEGHTDNVGKEEYNLKLSERRAETVATFLAEQEVTRERMVTKGYGMSQPVESNATPEGRQANRRVDLVISSE